MRQAESRFAEGTELDYDARDVGTSRLAIRLDAARLYMRACSLGDEAACWHAAVIKEAPRTLKEQATVAIGKNCLAGKAMSCRALLSWNLRQNGYRTLDDESKIAREACDAALAAGCWAVAVGAATAEERLAWYQRGCALNDAASCHRAWQELSTARSPGAAAAEARYLELARAECDRGFAPSCKLLVDADMDNEALRKKVLETSTIGCKLGLINECLLLFFDTKAPASVRAYGVGQECLTTASSCDELAQLHLDSGPLPDPEAARDAYEQGCQLGDKDICKLLAQRYLGGDLPEPVAGRGEALRAYVCNGDDPCDGFDVR